MNVSLDDTIAALASPPGPGARGIIRVSGPASRPALDRLFRPDDPDRWRSTAAAGRHPGRFPLTGSTAALPVDVYLWPDRRSYTGQPAAELHTIGSPPLLEAALSELYAAGIRPARPGEFTLRAFLAGKIDLVQAEAVLGVIDAHDHRELELALGQLAGGISGRVAAVHGDLIDLLADLEAGLDFVEEDIEFIRRDELIARVAAATSVLAELLEQATGRMQSTGRLRVVLAGLPNAGKSTLFNALAGREAALVSEFRGTTRDYLSAELDWNGTAVELIDTAGWELAGAGIMHSAQLLRGEQLDRADLVVWCTAADFDETARREDARLIETLRQTDRPVLVAHTKCDLPPAGDGSPADAESPAHDGTVGNALRGVPRTLSMRAASAERHGGRSLQDAAGVRQIDVSAHTRFGLAELADAAVSLLAADRRGSRQLVGTTAARCRESLATSIVALERAGEAAEAGLGEELVAIEVRDALEHLGRILGAVYTDDILDRIFSKFCIGK